MKGGRRERKRLGGQAQMTGVAAGSLGWGRRVKWDRRIQKISLRAQETLWWTL